MTLGFTGEHTQKVDSKGRMSVPADFRRVLEAGDPDWTTGLQVGLYVIYGDHLKDSLHVYTVTEYRKMMAEIEEMPKGDPNRKMVSHLMITQSEFMSIDKDGRVVLPLKRREKLGLSEGMLSFRGMVGHFEIWKDDTYQSSVGDKVKDWLADKGEDFDPLSMLGA